MRCDSQERYLKKFDEILCNMAKEMLSQNITNNITINFIKCMIPHHQAAIYMCKNLLDYTDYAPLRSIANDIIQTQTRGIEEMEEILNTTRGYINSRRDVNCYMSRYCQITQNMISRMKNSSRCCGVNLNFISEMIPHHEGAIQMCDNLIQYIIDPRLREVASAIITEQTSGVEELKKIRTNLCCGF